MESVLRPYGAREVSREELDLVEAPPVTATWYPLKHSSVLDTVLATLEGAGFAVQHQQLALSRSNHRLFATVDLTASVAPGIHLAVGIRNSTDQSYVDLNVMLDQVMISHRAQQFLFFWAA